MSIYLITEHRVSNIGPVEVISITAAQLNEKPPTDTELFLVDGCIIAGHRLRIGQH
nr:hypothetical protein [Desulfobulbaceae bacterium]